jgi:hypothetical protein
MEPNRAAFYIPDEQVGGRAVTLSRRISAIQLVRNDDGTVKLGLLGQLSAGTQITLCGEGFNERTVKVCTHGQYYFVFAQDLETQALAAAQ